MSPCNATFLGLFILVLKLQTCQAQSIVSCPRMMYMHNESCHRCPNNCHTCVSGTNCTLCEKGFYGLLCKFSCGFRCTGTCHMSYGHCTEGCPDGYYPVEGGDDCPACPDQCSLCESSSKCVVCEDGHFGVDCQKTCPEKCSLCDKTTGHCLRCKESHYLVNGECKWCSPGCGLCVSIINCSQCKDSYFLQDGQCKRCKHGCRLCSAMAKCQSCDDGFYGPVNGRCLYTCPTNRVTTYNVPLEDGRCGIWQDTNTNICHRQSESYSCRSRGNCLQYIRCNNNDDSVLGVDEMHEQKSCATTMHYDCKHTCKQMHTLYGCETTCTIEAQDPGRNNVLYMANIDPLAVQTFQNTEKAYCNKEKVTQTFTPGTPCEATVAVVVIVSGIVIVFMLMFFYKKVGIMQLISKPLKRLSIRKDKMKFKPTKIKLKVPDIRADVDVSRKVQVHTNMYEQNEQIRHVKATRDAEDAEDTEMNLMNSVLVSLH